MAKAQDNTRETMQKKRYGFTKEHTRDQAFDAFHKMNIEFKTKASNKGCTTKRRYKEGCFDDCVIVVTDYYDKTTLSETDYIVFPPALEEWRNEQERKLREDNGTIPCHNEIETILDTISDRMTPELERIMEKFSSQVHRNDPAIPKGFFDTCGEYTSINRKKTKVKHSEWFFKVGPEVDKPTFLREKIEEYLAHLK
jgi:hypothetical protein